MDLILEILIAALLVIGGIFGLIGSYGLLKLRDAMQRVHAPTKASTIGLATVLIASMVDLAHFQQDPSWHEALIVLFILMTAPVTAHFISKAILHQTLRPEDLPASGTGRTWATYDRPADPQPDTPPRP